MGVAQKKNNNSSDYFNRKKGVPGVKKRTQIYNTLCWTRALFIFEEKNIYAF